MRNEILFPLKKLDSNYKIKQMVGFDIETCDNNRYFILGTMSLPDDTILKFYSQQDMIKEMMKQKYRGMIFFASMMEFDAMGIFRHTEYEGKITPMKRNAFIFAAKTYVENGELVRFPKDSKKAWAINISDTLSYIPASVEQLGKIIGIPKMKHPDCFNRVPKNDKEWNEMEEYCANDSLISRKAMQFFFKELVDLGIKPKMTIASCAMDNFKRNHLTEPLKRMNQEDLDFAFESYYGAMNGVYRRGFFDSEKEGNKLYYHDVNNMYGSVMFDAKLPHPNYMHRAYLNDTRYIMQYEGCSKVDIVAPSHLKYPLLHFKNTKDKRSIAPIGSFSGTYTHLELREALSAGYHINKVYSSLYSTSTMAPFGYIKDYFDIRLRLKKEGNPKAEVYKLLINSTYGKFGERGKKNKKAIYFKDATIDEITDPTMDRVEDYIFITPPLDEPKAHCHPLWASYITALARIKLWKYMIIHNGVYVDTDSLICDHFIEDSEELGRLKLEMTISKAYFIRSKFYACLPEEYETMSPEKLKKESKLKIKGVSKRILTGNILALSETDYKKDDVLREEDEFMNFEMFEKIISKKEVMYKKFMRFNESIRRRKKQNEAVIVKKNLDLEDTKRFWGDTIKFDKMYDSYPVLLKEGIPQDVIVWSVKKDVMSEM